MNKTMKILTDAECDMLLTALQKPFDESPPRTKYIRNYLIALLMLDAGLRVGEVVSLRVGDLWVMDSPVGMISVVTEKQKFKNTRHIPVTIRLNNAIAEYAERDWTLHNHPPAWFAFRRNFNNSSISCRQVERFIRKAALASLHRPVHPHILRHTFATRLMTKCSIRVVQQLLGHASISSTQVYTHPNSQDLQTAIDTLNTTGEKNCGKPDSKPVNSC